MNLRKIKIESLLEKHGIPLNHARIFQRVAKQKDVVISTRTPGPACGMLLRQGYDAKGFWVKSKSCDWGPMAGFVCLDPLFNKSWLEGAFDNIKYAYKSLSKAYEKDLTASAIQIRINEDRFDWLLEHMDKPETISTTPKYLNVKDDEGKIVGYRYKLGNIDILLKKEEDELYHLYYDIMELYEIAEDNGNLADNLYRRTKEILAEYFIEKRAEKKDKEEKTRENIEKYSKKLENLNENDKTLEDFWELLAGKKHLTPARELENYAGGRFKHFRPLMAMANPHKSYSGDLNYLNALTGDYDLFAAWPQVVDYDLDKRAAGMTQILTDKRLIEKEENDDIGNLVGNISERIFDIAQTINSYLQNEEPEPNMAKLQANRVYHSDEGGRPSVGAVDSAVGFGPDGEVFEIGEGTEAADLSAAMVYFGEKGYTCFINKGWDYYLSDEAKRYRKYIGSV